MNEYLGVILIIFFAGGILLILFFLFQYVQPFRCCKGRNGRQTMENGTDVDDAAIANMYLGRSAILNNAVRLAPVPRVRHDTSSMQNTIEQLDQILSKQQTWKESILKEEEYYRNMNKPIDKTICKPCEQSKENSENL